MKEVYFDTNVYTQIDKLLQKKELAAYDKLRRAVDSDRLRIYTSLIVYEETNTALIDYPKEGIRRLRLVRKLAKRKKFIRLHYDILADDIRSYAKDEPFRSRFMAPPPRLKEMHEHKPVPELVEAAKETRDYIRGHRDKVRAAYSTHIEPLAKE